MIITNPFTGMSLNADVPNPEGCNQHTGPNCGITKTKVGTHVSSNLESLLKGLEDRPKVGMSLARHRGEEMSSPTLDEPKGKTGRALIKVSGKGLDYDRPDHRALIDKMLEEDSENIIPNLRAMGIDWVDGWNSIGSDEELHLISPSKAQVLKAVEAPLERLRKEAEQYRTKVVS
jgi:hypothetical protein